jgi:hypothetical protein
MAEIVAWAVLAAYVLTGVNLVLAWRQRDAAADHLAEAQQLRDRAFEAVEEAGRRIAADRRELLAASLAMREFAALWQYGAHEEAVDVVREWLTETEAGE